MVYYFCGLQHLTDPGLRFYPSGRMNEPASLRLSQSLKSAGFQLGRLKTGTPARLAKRSIDFSKLPVQKGDDPPMPFSFMNSEVEIKVPFLALLNS